jgi:23S rRNA (adenine2503-C2)-methyltransferase
LSELREALDEVTSVPGQSVMIQYLMLAGLTDSLADARRLLAYLDGLDCHINLIPYNPVEGPAEFRPTPRPQRDEFAQLLRQAGYVTTIRYSQGADVDAACGQLAAARGTDA